MVIKAFGKAAASILLSVFMGLGICTAAPVGGILGEGRSTISNEASSSLPSVYQKWLEEDVCWIINPDERAAFLRLSNNEERDHFVEQFWLRRDPTPGSGRNKFKEEHYRRLAYANEHFAAGSPGWKTDRGRIYIIYGPPDSITVEPVTRDSLKPTEIWQYHLKNGEERDFKF